MSFPGVKAASLAIGSVAAVAFGLAGLAMANVIPGFGPVVDPIVIAALMLPKG